MAKLSTTVSTSTTAKTKTKATAADILGLSVKPAPQASARVTALVTELADIRQQLTELNARKDEIGARLTKRVTEEGESDEEGKIRLQTDTHAMVVVDAENRSVSAKTLLALGVKASVIAKATTVTPYRYVSVTAKRV